MSPKMVAAVAQPLSCSEAVDDSNACPYASANQFRQDPEGLKFRSSESRDHLGSTSRIEMPPPRTENSPIPPSRGGIVSGDPSDGGGSAEASEQAPLVTGAGSFVPQRRVLAGRRAGVRGARAVGAEDRVAGHEVGERFGAVRCADPTGGGGVADAPRGGRVGDGLAGGDLARGAPRPTLERRPAGV